MNRETNRTTDDLIAAAMQLAPNASQDTEPIVYAILALVNELTKANEIKAIEISESIRLDKEIRDYLFNLKHG